MSKLNDSFSAGFYPTGRTPPDPEHFVRHLAHQKTDGDRGHKADFLTTSMTCVSHLDRQMMRVSA